MAAITDLTWQQLLDKLPANSIILSAGKVMIDVSILTNSTVDTLTDNEVVKAIATLVNAGNLAQVTANDGKAPGERLAAFPTPTTGTPANGFVPITRSVVSRSELATATNIIGQLA